MNVIERIKTQLSAAPVVLYMKGTPDFPQCGFSAQTVGALRASKAQFTSINIFEDPEVREALKTYSNWPTALRGSRGRGGRRLAPAASPYQPSVTGTNSRFSPRWMSSATCLPCSPTSLRICATLCTGLPSTARTTSPG